MIKKPIADLVQLLIPHLPRYAEEEGDFYAVKRTELVQIFCQQGGVELALAENTLDFCEILLDSLATLDRYYLQQGEWCFVSFPAQLMALSVLNTLCDAQSHFFETRPEKPHFWTTNSISTAKKEQQYLSLKQFEQARYRLHTAHKAVPIRFIHVAWALINVEGRILFYQREDTKKRFDKQAGDYGLIGGRANQYDFDDTKKTMQERLALLQSANRAQINTVLTQTLQRELFEEVGLVVDKHYHYQPWRALKPYQQVQGAAPNYALTEYFISLFSVELTLEGFCFLHKKIEQDVRLAWFSLDEMIKGVADDGKMAFINALVDDFDETHDLKQALLTLGNSFSSHYQANKKNITLPRNASVDLLKGTLGKEQAYPLNLNAEQWRLLMGLASHQRGFTFSSLHPDIQLHPYGWVEVHQSSKLKRAFSELFNDLHDKDLALEAQHECYYRLSVDPEHIFFDDTWFTWSIQSAPSSLFSIKRKAFDTALGEVCEEEKSTPISQSLASNLIDLSKGQLKVDADSVKDNYRKSVKIEKALGLRALLKGSGDKISICCQLVQS